MRLAVFSDIHANAVALETCLAYADHVGTDGYVFLGDYVTDCPYPQRTLSLIKNASERKPSWMLRGNREDLLIRHHQEQDADWTASSATGSLLYTYQNLDSDDISFLKRMPLSDIIKLPGCPPLCIAHATPKSNDALVYPGSDALESILRTSPEQTLVSGHSHFQFRYESNGRQFINPGSVGMPFYGQPKAQFCFISCLGGRWSARLMNVDYDKEAEISQFKESGLLDIARIWAVCSIKTIRSGGRWAFECSQLAQKLSGQLYPTEDAWQEAAKQLGIVS